MVSLRIPLLAGTLKIKSKHRLRHQERDGEVAVWRFGDLCISWWPPDTASKRPVARRLRTNGPVPMPGHAPMAPRRQ